MKSAPARPSGRPRTPDQIGELVLQIARENAWGSMRVRGKLKKLGVRGVSRSTVVNILRGVNIDPGPTRDA